MSAPRRIVCWFSCGAASAYAAKLVLERAHERFPGRDVVIAYCASTLSTEHPDNRRFLADCERWFGQPIEMLYADNYADTWDVYERTRWLVGPEGARCTHELKKRVRQVFEEPFSDIQVFGFTVEEKKRASDFYERNPEALPWFPLIEEEVSKASCLKALQSAGIEIPAMYLLGYRNNNCIGCVKGGMGYWNKIRRDFPEVFECMAKLERELGVSICKRTGKIDPETGKKEVLRIYLDELDPNAGRYEQEPDISCGVLCMPGQLQLFNE